MSKHFVALKRWVYSGKTNFGPPPPPHPNSFILKWLGDVYQGVGWRGCVVRWRALNQMKNILNENQYQSKRGVKILPRPPEQNPVYAPGYLIGIWANSQYM